MEKKAVQGMRFMPGEMLYQIADLSSVWVMADVFEQDIGAGQDRQPRPRSGSTPIPDKVFEGKVTYVYPTLKPETRTVPVRVELANPRQLLKPAMYAQVELPVGGKAQGADRADLGGDRQRHAPDRAGAARAKAASSRARSSSARAATTTSRCWRA